MQRLLFEFGSEKCERELAVEVCLAAITLIQRLLFRSGGSGGGGGGGGGGPADNKI
jgi:hypothetical protein